MHETVLSGHADVANDCVCFMQEGFIIKSHHLRPDGQCGVKRKK